MRKTIFLKWLQIAAGLLVFAFGVHLTIFANIGLAPWDCLGMGISYLRICFLASFGLFCQVVHEKYMQSTGKTILSMTTQTVGAVVNIILEPILINGMFGLPTLGIEGAAYATVTGQIISAIVGIYLQKTNRI